MFAIDRFHSLLPRAPLFKSKLSNATDELLQFIPKTSKEYDNIIILHQFWPAWNIIAYIRMAGLTCHVQNSRYPSYESTGTLPQLNDGNYLVSKDDIIPHLQTYHSDIDDKLTGSQRADLYAYKTIITQKLAHVVNYCIWVDEIGYKEVTREQLKQVIPFPLNHILPKWLRKSETSEVMAHGINSREKAYVVARDCYASLNAKLANDATTYMFGNEPSSLDVEVFGHVVNALNNALLRDVLLEYGPSLVEMAKVIRDNFFDLSDLKLTEAYTENEVNVLQGQYHIMAPISNQIVRKLIKPYTSPSWAKRALMQEIVQEKLLSRQVEAKNAPCEPIYSKGRRNVIIGALVAFTAYTFSLLPFQIALSVPSSNT